MLAGLCRRRTDGGHAEARHLRAEHVHIDLGGVIGGAGRAVGHVDLQPYLIAHVQATVARRDVEALPVGELVVVGAHRVLLPGDARLVRIIERMEELCIAFGEVDDLDEEERLLACRMVGVVEDRCHREAQMDLAVDRVDVAQHHGRFLLHRVGSTCAVTAELGGRRAGERITGAIATGVGRDACGGQDAEIAAKRSVERIGAGMGFLYGTQRQLAAIGRRHRCQRVARAGVALQLPLGEALRLEATVLDLRVYRRDEQRQQRHQCERSEDAAPAFPSIGRPDPSSL